MCSLRRLCSDVLKPNVRCFKASIHPQYIQHSEYIKVKELMFNQKKVHLVYAPSTRVIFRKFFNSTSTQPVATDNGHALVQ